MKRFELTYKFTLVVLVAFLLVVGCDDDRDTYVPVPVITTIQPDSGAVLPGEFVTIFGGNFSPIANENIVTLGGIMATVTEAANNQLTIIVPEGAENGIISVTVNGQTGTARKQLTIINQVQISGVLPTTIFRQDTLTVTGLYFGATIAENTAKINDIDATVVSASLRELKLVVPTNAELGPAMLSVTAREQTATAEDLFTILDYPPFSVESYVLAPVADIEIKKVSSVNENVTYIVGEEGNVFKSTAPGTWVSIPHGTEDLDDVHAFDELTALVCGDEGTLARTTDGGTNWSAISVLGTDETLRRMHFISDTEGWLVGSDGVIFKTIDGGDTWEDLNPIADMVTGARTYGFHSGENENPRFYGVFFLDADTGFVVGEHDTTLKTTNGGTTWTTTLLTTGEDLSSIVFQDAQNGWIVGKDNVLLATTDGGAIWTDQGISLDSGGDDINDIAILSSTNIIAVADDHQLIKSEDGGANWVVVDLESTLGISISDHIDGIDAYAGKAVIVGEGSFIGY
jgi:photosystem II stability/assembly factor-like uncharacterized protein